VLEHQTKDAADKVRYLQGFNVRPNRIELINESYVSAAFDRAHPKSRLQENDILTVQSGHIGTTARVPKELTGSNCHALIITRPRPELIDSRYLTAYLNSHIGQARMRGLHVGSSIVHINTSELSEFRVPCPPLPEQRKIADILTTWDEALSKLDDLIAAQEFRKKALMQRLLSRSSAHFKTSHAQHRLGDVMERVTRRNTAGSKNVLTISAQGGLVNQQEYFNRSVAAEDLSGYYLLRQGEFAYNRSSAKGYPFGAIKRLDNYDQGVVSTLYLCFRLRDGTQASSAYLCHYFEGGYLNSGLRMIAKEGARAHGLLNVTADEFFELDIFLPTLPEQQKIAEILDTADQQLTLLRTQRTALDQQKRGLMQRLLTGKLRTQL
jgi:type I restriction enzyme S subunit